MMAFRRLACGCQQGAFPWLCAAHREAAWRLALADEQRAKREAWLRSPPPESADCPDALLPDGEVCPRCGGPRAPSGSGGGSWVHFPRYGERIVDPAAPSAGEREEPTND